jgi:hypothetical protein
MRAFGANGTVEESNMAGGKNLSNVLALPMVNTNYTRYL